MFSELKDVPRLLIIDDDEQIRCVLRDVLGEAYSCTDVSSGEEALALLNTEKFNLVLTDIMMEGLSGLELVPLVLEQLPDAAVIMISGEQTIEVAIEAMRVGAFDYITKPFDLLHLEAAVKRAYEHHQLLAGKRRYESELKELVEQRTAELNHLSYHDVLTGLPNRVLFEDRLSQAVTSARLKQEMLGMLFLSVDRVKKINDTLGHAVGDRLLREVAGRLLRCPRGGATVARFESDEFAMLLTHISGTDDLIEISNCIREMLKSPFLLEGQELFVTVSIGISLCPDDGSDPQSLLKNAGAALYRAKEMGGNNYQFYTADMNTRAFKRLAMESSLRRAIERKEFSVYYQPQINISTRQIVGAEALVRWHHPDLGFVLPAEFIPLAEDTGLIVPIGEWVLRTACAQAMTWQAVGFGSLRLSVNLSPRQFQQHDLSETVIRILSETGFSPTQLDLELTEGSIMKNAEFAIRVLGELKELGIQSSLDDFGTGYSSLSYLKRLPIDTLKIDQSFVRDATTDPDDAAIVMAIITLAHNLRLKVIAEGVETEEQLRFLHLLKCDEMQGYLFSRPLPAEEFQRLLEGRQDIPQRGEVTQLFGLNTEIIH